MCIAYCIRYCLLHLHVLFVAHCLIANMIKSQDNTVQDLKIGMCRLN